MGMPGREVTEYISKEASLWLINGPGQLFSATVTVRSPLTGAWLVQANTTGGTYVRSWRAPCRREARRSALGGNGRLMGGHPEVTEIRARSKTVILGLAGV